MRQPKRERNNEEKKVVLVAACTEIGAEAPDIEGEITEERLRELKAQAKGKKTR